MPEPEIGETGIGVRLEGRLTLKQLVGEQGREMLQRTGDGELPALGHETTGKSEQEIPHLADHLHLRKTGQHGFVEALMHRGVHRLLIHEVLHLGQKHGIGNPFLIILNRVDKELLPSREEEGNGVVEKLGALHAARPGIRIHLAEAQVNLPTDDLYRHTAHSSIIFIREVIFGQLAPQAASWRARRDASGVPCGTNSCIVPIASNRARVNPSYRCDCGLLHYSRTGRH
jgi:hypothetical protein